MSQIKDYPEIQFEIGIQPSEMILQDLLEGKIDFGFIVGERLNPAIRFEKFADEHYSALAARGDLLKSLEEKNFAELRIIGYPGWELFFTTWAKDHGIWNKIKNRISSPTVRIGTLAGAIHATQEGAGIAILPTHCVLDEIKNKKLKVYSGQSKTSTNPIYVVRRLGETLPKRSQLILDLLKKSKAELG